MSVEGEDPAGAGGCQKEELDISKVPAFGTTKSMPPNVEIVVEKADWRSVQEVTSHLMKMALGGWEERKCWQSSEILRSAIATLRPEEMRSLTNSRPIPEAPPVIMATELGLMMAIVVVVRRN